MSVSEEMPKYKSHKEVWAFKIKSIVRDGEGENRESYGSAIITPEEEGYAPFKVEGDYLHKHKPQVGGYYVVYKDGYNSFSPANAFEEGYSKIENYSMELFDFGQAINFLKEGKRVSRKGWNGNGMYAYYVPANSYPASTEIAKKEFNGELVPYRPYLALKTAQNDIATWNPSTSDCLATDWFVVQ